MITSEWHDFPCIECGETCSAKITLSHSDVGTGVLDVEAPRSCRSCGAIVWEDEILEFIAEERMYEEDYREEMWGEIDWGQ